LSRAPADRQAELAAARDAALAALRQREFGAAMSAVRQLAALQAAGGGADSAHAHAELGDLWSLLADYPAAQASYTRAVELAPTEPRYWFNRGAVRRFLGEIEAAETDYDHVIALSPDDAQAYLNRSELRTQTPERNHTVELERALERVSASWQQEVTLRYALAKEYEDVGEYTHSWQHLSAGAGLRRRHLEYDPRIDLATVGWIIEAFPAEPAVASGASSDEPIFIIGMPRTGSTLVDRILGNHSQIYSAGELPDLSVAIVAAVQRRRAGKLSRQELVAASAQLDFRELGEDYLRRTRPRTGHTPHFTDKLPLNYLYCGLIARALPRARMVHVTRGPMATCFGMYKVLFDRGYPFSYDLQELADHYLGYRRLMAHWCAVLPGRIIEVNYEKLVADAAGEVRRLLDALALPWEPQCLAYERNPAPVATASAAQVRRPIYTSAVSVWRNYKRELAPLAARLEAGGIPADS
jgi:Sulfotransferase family/Tetratricopeptide repeat